MPLQANLFVLAGLGTATLIERLSLLPCPRISHYARYRSASGVRWLLRCKRALGLPLAEFQRACARFGRIAPCVGEACVSRCFELVLQSEIC